MARALPRVCGIRGEILAGARKYMALQRSRMGLTLAAIVSIAAIVMFTAAGCTPLQSSSYGSTSRPTSTSGSSGSSSRSSSSTSGRGATHTVQKGQTLWGISKAYGVGLAEIVEANDLDDYTISIGQKIHIPGVSKALDVKPSMPSAEEVAADVGGKLAWPLAGRGRSSITSVFGYRDDPITGGRKFHKGVDIDGAREERVLSAAAGEVVYSGRMSGYGTVVMLDHGSRLLTVYAHLSRSNVRLEERVARGQTIGYVGSSGRANGTHLHFEVRYKGVSVDPMDYLP